MKIKRTIRISKFVDWESNPKLLFQIIYDQTYNHDFTKLTIHKFNNRFCLTLTDCFSFLPPQSNFRTYYRTFSSYYRLSLSNFKKNKRNSLSRAKMMNRSKLVFGCSLRPGSLFVDFFHQNHGLLISEPKKVFLFWIQ